MRLGTRVGKHAFVSTSNSEVIGLVFVVMFFATMLKGAFYFMYLLALGVYYFVKYTIIGSYWFTKTLIKFSMWLAKVIKEVIEYIKDKKEGK